MRTGHVAKHIVCFGSCPSANLGNRSFRRPRRLVRNRCLDGASRETSTMFHLEGKCSRTERDRNTGASFPSCGSSPRPVGRRVRRRRLRRHPLPLVGSSPPQARPPPPLDQEGRRRPPQAGRHRRHVRHHQLDPKTLEEALPSDPAERPKDTRPIVVTEMTGTFNMIGCNKAWENLCGYAECEIAGKDSSILQGPETKPHGPQGRGPEAVRGGEARAGGDDELPEGRVEVRESADAGEQNSPTGKMSHCVAILKDISK